VREPRFFRAQFGDRSIDAIPSHDGKPNPKKSHLLKIAAYAGLNEADMLLLDHDAFRRTIKGEEVKTDLILVSLRSIRKNLSRSSAIFSTYKGQYIIYYVGTNQTIGSLLTIQRTTPEGIRFQLLNPYREATGEWVAFDYAGYMYPVGDLLYLLGEQPEKDYEIISLIFQSSPSPKVGALRGIITGIGVRHDRSHIAARPFIAIRRQKLIDDWRKALSKELGYLTLVRPAGSPDALAAGADRTSRG